MSRQGCSWSSIWLHSYMLLKEVSLTYHYHFLIILHHIFVAFHIVHLLVSFEIFALLSGTCLCIWMAPGIKTEVFGTRLESLVGSHGCMRNVLDCIHHVSTWSESMAYMTLLITNGLRGLSMLLSGFILPRCLCMGKWARQFHQNLYWQSCIITILVISHQNFWTLVQQGDAVVTHAG